MKAKYVIGTAIILIFVMWGVSAFFKTTVRYVSFADARSADRTVQVVGRIDFESVFYDEKSDQLIFTIHELKTDDSATPDRLKIIYSGIVPGNFYQATSVRAIGKAGPNGFVAEKLHVKCPSKYQGLVNDSQG
jgi:cytochrome c-type biogenesis protein CcmE